MEILLFWIIGSLFVGAMGSNTTLGFGSALLISAIFSPVVGFVVVLLYPSKANQEKRLKEQQTQTELLKQMNAGSSISVASELEKLQSHLEKGIITDEEFQEMKKKLIAKL